MTKPYYKVWMDIEFIDEDNDVYEDVDAEIMNCGEHFDTLEEAVAYRNSLINQPWSVLLRYPDSEETYYTWVDAPNNQEAMMAAKKQMIAVNEGIEPEDIAVVLVLRGHVEAELREGDGV